jgi:ATP-dependent Clp protease ATP-binding subunit ClpC
MGQFKTKESMSGFIGAPPGYVGYGEGKLTNGLRDKPECVVLFDEIEKADVQVFDTLLRFADEGMISDPAGPVRDGRKCVIVMTTNAGQTWLRENPEKRDDPNLPVLLFENALQELVQCGFRPEFLGRIDERIAFLPFTPETCRKIVDGVLGREIEKFKRMKDISIVVADKVLDFLADKAYERANDEGARGAPRAVNEYIVTPMIDFISELEEERESGTAIKVDVSLLGKPPRVILETTRASGETFSYDAQQASST